MKNKEEYLYFDMSLYIKNNFVYGNDKIMYRYETDEWIICKDIRYNFRKNINSPTVGFILLNRQA